MSRCEELFEEAKQYIPGGVNSPVRSFSAVGGVPKFFKRGDGAHLIDEDGKRYIDYVGSWGPMVVGHAHPRVTKAVGDAIKNSLSFGAPTSIEVEMAKKVCGIMKHMDMVRMINSGTEATMTALRIARGYTNKNKIIKFSGCYHGHEDCLLVKAGSGVATLGLPSSAGVPKSVTENTLVADFNNLDEVKKLFEEHGDDIAAVILEPVAGNMGCLSPLPGFLPGLRKLCDEYQSLLIMDEVMTGFRVALGGAQEKYDIVPDLTTLGKVIGGGMPVGAVGGKREIMNVLAPLGPVYQAGTLSGNPIAMTAGLATLNVLTSDPDFHNKLAEKSERIVSGVLELAKKAGVPMAGNVEGGMFGLWFTEKETLTNYEGISSSNIDRFNRFFHLMLDQGIYLPPSAYEACFISSAHGDEEIEKTLVAVEKALSSL
jgi:glutamate-1-semialdehyde 2,1-aminomutase